MLRLVLILVLVAAAVLLVFWNPVATGEDQRDAAPEAREELGAVSSTDTAPSKVVAESEPIEAPQPNLEVGPLSIMVFVTDDTGAPLSDARVLFLPELANPLGGPTDTSGFCMLRVPTAERGTVRAEFMGRAEEVADVFPSNVEPIVVHVQFQKAVTVEVRVEDTAGAPIEGAVVALAEHPFVHYPDRMVQRPMSQSTDEHGFARFSSVGGAVFHLRVTKAGYFAIAKGLRARYDDPYVTVVVMEAGEQVTIRALSDRDEQPVPNVGVYVNFDKPLDGRYLPPIGLHFTDHAGEVHFSRPAGTGGSCFVPSDYRWGGFMALPPQQELVILRLDSGVAARCRIRMEGSNDWIMAPCTLHTKTTFRGEIRAEAVLPDQEGFYIAENQGHPYAPEFRFELLGVGFTDWKKVSHRGTLAHPVELVLKPYAQVTFEVYSVVGNAPVPGARVEARELMANSEAFLETPHSKRVASTLSNELGQGVLRLHSEGLYESPRLGEVEALGMLRLHGKGRYEVFVDGGPSLGRAWRTIDMTAAPTSDLGRILVDGRGSLDLAVVHSGRPAAFYHGWIASDTLGEPGGSSERYRFKTDALGRTLVQGLAPRTYRILVSGPSVLPPTMIPVAWKLVPNSNPFLVSVASSGPTSYTVVIP